MIRVLVSVCSGAFTSLQKNVLLAQESLSELMLHGNTVILILQIFLPNLDTICN